MFCKGFKSLPFKAIFHAGISGLRSLGIYAWGDVSSAQHGKLLGGVNPFMSLAAGIISQRQGRHREVGSEGSSRQNLALRYTNRIRPSHLGKPADYGKALWLHGRYGGRYGRCWEKVTCLI